MSRPVQDFFDSTCRREYIGKPYKGAAPQSIGRDHCGFRVVSVLRVENPLLWEKYAEERSAIAARCGAEPARPGRARLEGVTEHLHEGANEALLFHGTVREHVGDIWRHGFDDRVASPGGLLGAGIYFAEDSSKSDEYCAPDGDGTCTLYLARVVLGRAFETPRFQTALRRPPRRPDDPGRPCDSVVAVTAETHPGADLEGYRQFAVYERRQAYPALLVEFRRVDAAGADQGWPRRRVARVASRPKTPSRPESRVALNKTESLNIESCYNQAV